MRRIVVAVMVLTVLPACGARWTDAQEAEVAARSSRVVAPEAAGASDIGEALGSTATTALDASGSLAGDGPVTETGTGSVRSAQGSLPCAAPSTEKGVTASTITVGEISSLTGPVPGLGAPSAAAVRAHVALRNSRGGVCGRRIVLKEADDGTDISRYRSALRQLNPDVLGISGGFSVGDAGSEDTINELKIPIVNSPTGRTGELRWVFDINPDFARPDLLIGKYKYLYDQGVRTAAVSYIAVDQSRLEAGIQQGLMKAAGIKIVLVRELPLSTISYDSAARDVANSKADYLWFTSAESGQIEMAKAVRDTGYNWKVREFAYTAYGGSFIQAAGAAAEGGTTWLRSLPLEEASTNASMQNYVTWMDRAAPGLQRDLFSIDSWSAATAFFDALEALPGPISREALVQQLSSMHNFDAAGMFAPIDLGRDLSKGCFLGLVVKNGKWQRLVPVDRGYIC